MVLGPLPPLGSACFLGSLVPSTQSGDLTLESVFLHSCDYLGSCRLETFESPERCRALIIRYEASGLLFFLPVEVMIKEERAILS